MELSPGATVIERDCPLFVPLVEEGITGADDIISIETAKRYLEPMCKAGVDTLILGCTHYPVLSDVLKKVMGDGVTLINMGEATAQYVKDYLNEHNMTSDAKKDSEYYVSDKSESFSAQARILLGDSEITATQVDIEKYE